MALSPPLSFWSTSRHALRPLRSLAARAVFREDHYLVRHPTSLRERNDPLNEPITDENIEESRPRWSYTPERLKGIHGFSLNKIRDPSRAIWSVNEDPAKLDEFYERFLGHQGSRLLPEEIKWIAVTHKSFDYGRRGFNTRLAFFGRHIMVIEAMNEIMTLPNATEDYFEDPWKREHFQSPALRNVDKLSVARPQNIMPISAVASVGLKYRLDEVMRWKPRNPHNLKGSGIETVLVTTLFAIIGALSLQNGGQLANNVAREKIIGKVNNLS